jgi:hypothetical protein
MNCAREMERRRPRLRRHPKAGKKLDARSWKLDRFMPPIQPPASSLQLPLVKALSSDYCPLSPVPCPLAFRPTSLLDATELLP